MGTARVKLDVDTRFERPVYARLRRICAALPGVEETTAWGHPSFRVGGRTFCTFEIWRDRPTIAMKAAPAEVRRLSARLHFVATPYGRRVYVSRWLDVAINWRQLEALIERSYKLTATEKRSRPGTTKTRRARRDTT